MPARYRFCYRQRADTDDDGVCGGQTDGAFYAAVYEGTDPVSGRERRRWHRCPTRPAAGQLARRLDESRQRLRRRGSSLTLGGYLLDVWLPGKESSLSPATHARYRTSVEHSLLPHLGHVPLGRLRNDHLSSLYRRLEVCGSRRGRPLTAKTIANLHLNLPLETGHFEPA